jgi:3-hydroxy-D-aspartate aldolase
MTTSPAATIGMPLEEIDTPALLLDLDAFERNLKHMADTIAGTSVDLTPHAKSHKCPIIALRQIDYGAVRICCQKVSEAEAMVHGGVRDIFICNEIVGASKLERLAALARHARVAVCADHPANVNALSEVAQRYGVEFSVLVELDVGMNRCGIEGSEATVRLARQISGSGGLRFAGLQAYHGAAQHRPTFEERRQAIQSAVEKVTHTKHLLEGAGLPCERIAGAGTGTYRFELASGVYTELQPGSYVFMDVDYGSIQGEDGELFREFEHSLFIYTQVMSQPNADHVVVDAGMKAFTIEKGMPWVYEIPDVEFIRASDEHGVIKIKNTQRNFQLGEKVKLIPPHCDPTVNLHDWYVVIRENRVEALWPITARGPGY